MLERINEQNCSVCGEGGMNDSGLSLCLEMPGSSSSAPAVCSLDLSLFQITESQDNKLCYNGELLGEKQSL